jgi:hypothetical protein
MVPLSALWLPIILSGLAAFVISNLVHMVLGYHKHDYLSVPKEDAVMDALRPFDIPPGDYMMPRAKDMADMKSTDFQAKWKRGPVITMTVLPAGVNFMGATLAQWFVFCVVVSLFAAYIGGVALGPGADSMRILQVVGCVTFIGYAVGLWPISIWYKRSIFTTLRHTFDALMYGLAAGGIFIYFWPAQ